VTRLAIDGGDPVRTVPFQPWPSFTEDDVDAVADVLRSGKVNYWTGPLGRRFEESFASYVGTRSALSMMNGTVALHAALAALDLHTGDEVLVPARTFVATANAVVLAGGVPVFADVDPDTQCISVESAAACVTDRTRGVIAVHLGGWPAPMRQLRALAAAHDLFVIEDCAQALGATLDGAMVGSLGDAAAFSFCQDKIVTTGGEGGMLTCSDDDVWQRAWSLRDHGKSYARSAQQQSDAWGVAFCWLNDEVGSNWRMTEMQAALGLAALKKLPAMLDIRRSHAAQLDAGFGSIRGLRVTVPPSGVGHAYYKYYAFVRPDVLAEDWTRDRIAAAVNAEGIPCFTGSCPEVYLEDSFVRRDLGPAERLPIAKTLGENSLMFLVHPTLTSTEMADTVDAVGKVMRQAVR